MASAFEKLIDRFIECERRDYESTRARQPYAFAFERKAKELIEPATTKAKHHRDREKFYTGELEKAEKDLRERGVTVEAINPATGISETFNHLSSGGIQNSAATFQPQIDQKMLNAVKKAKEKMFEHRDKALQYEKYAAAFQCAPDLPVEINVETVYYFGLEV